MGQAPPPHESVEHGEESPDPGPEDDIAQRRILTPPEPAPVGRRGLVGGLACPVEVAERAETVGGVPRIEGDPVDDPGLLHLRDCGGIALANGEHGHRLRW